MSKLFDFFKEGSGQEDSGEKKDKKDMRLVVKESRCPQNHVCPSVRVCPTGALAQNGNSAPVIDMEKCIKCGKCVRFCPMRALVLE
jgi:Dissimilatory sulfite reductase (desulfoviridin), alpha and beta subunits